MQYYYQDFDSFSAALGGNTLLFHYHGEHPQVLHAHIFGNIKGADTCFCVSLLCYKFHVLDKKNVSEQKMRSI